MSAEKKVCCVSDQVHGSITLSQLEKCLISTPEYNRLHNVLQDSTVYLTYPSNRTSRFIHSLGTAHIVASLFRYSLNNANETTARNFFNAFRNNLIVLVNSEAFSVDLNHLSLNNSEDNLKRCHVERDLDDPFYLSETPSRYASKESCYQYSLMLQAVRLAACLHDIGHPPFSHVTENALGDLLAKLKEDHSNQLKRKTLNILEDARCAKGAGKECPFHEALGQSLAEFILHDAYYAWSSRRNEKAKYFGLLVKHLTLQILKDASSFSMTLHTLISSDIDGDRIDYVLRDSAASGLGVGSLQLDRLLTSFCLVQLPARTHKEVARKLKQNQNFAFVPSVRALSVLESLFRSRFALYRQVVFHHRVVKMDALLKSSIAHLTNEFLDGRLSCCATGCKKKETMHNSKLVKDFLLPDNISGLWTVLSESSKRTTGQRHNYYLQWDDAWLLGVLRRRFMELQACSKLDKRSPICVQLSELLSNAKHYHSLFKRGDEFIEVEEGFLDALKESSAFNQLLGGNEPHLKRLCSLFGTNEQTKAFVSESYRGSSERGDGLFLNALFSFLDSEERSGFKKLGLDLIADAIEEMKHGQHIADAIYIRKRIKAGIKTSQSICSGGGAVLELGRMSRIVSELDAQLKFFPPFFVFILPNAGNLGRGVMSSLRTIFGKCYFNAFHKSIVVPQMQLPLPVVDKPHAV